MRRVTLSLVMILLALFSMVRLIPGKADAPVTARIVRVSRGDVHQVCAITGRLTYAREEIIYTGSSGIVSRVYVEAGQRVAAREALIRWQAEETVAAVAASAMGSEWEQLDGQTLSWASDALDGQLVTRAEQDAYVRQVYVTAEMPVAAGSPVARLSSGEQQIRCSANCADAEAIRPGMWAWLSSEGEAQGIGTVVSVSERQVDAQSGLSFVEVLLECQEHLNLPEGAAVDVEVFLAGSDDVLTLPVEAITARETVWWVTDGRCTEVPANVLLRDEMQAWVDLPEGMTVAVGEFEDGQRVLEAAE